MSRIAKKPIAIPPKTEASFAAGILSIKGPLGELKKTFKSDIDIKVENGAISIAPAKPDIENFALWGSYASHIKNMLSGVNKAYERKLIIEGIGFKADVKGKDLVLAVGFSHPVSLIIPDGLKVVSDKTGISISGIDAEMVGQFAAKVRAVKKPEPYKGKGIRYADEVIRRKQGKKAV
ncbi:MAG: 50S ribosomal protein L6 [Patescibacteria group bacterium]|nr:50S ribosomal protein L6 [Patescibacteria group bacterium]